MICYLLYMNVDKNNIDKWEKLLIKLKKHSLSNAEKRILNDFDVSDIYQYISLIKSNINDESKINLIIDNYNQKKNERLRLESIINNANLDNLIKNSIKINKIDNNIIIRLLTKTDRENAIKLYEKFKQSMGIENYIDDFILKNTIFGIYEKEELAGIVIVEYNRHFTIEDRIPTYYIQELFIDDDYRRRGFASLLFKYLILNCPTNLNYITFMTHPSNIPMINISKKYNFSLCEKSSGDVKNPLLYIRTNSQDDDEIKSAFL